MATSTGATVRTRDPPGRTGFLRGAKVSVRTGGMRDAIGVATIDGGSSTAVSAPPDFPDDAPIRSGAGPSAGTSSRGPPDRVSGSGPPNASRIAACVGARATTRLSHDTPLRALPTAGLVTTAVMPSQAAANPDAAISRANTVAVPGEKNTAASMVPLLKPATADDQAGQRLGVTVDALDLAEACGARGGHSGIAERYHRNVAALARCGEGAHAIGAGEHHRLNARQRPLQRGRGSRLLRCR